MIQAAFKAFSDLVSRDFRSVLWTAVGMSFALFVALFLGVQAVFWFLTLVPWPWLETVLAVGTGLGLLLAFFFLMTPVTAVFAGLFLDRIADKVEARHYPHDRPGAPLATLIAVATTMQFSAIVLMINILALPFVFTGFGAVVLLVVNAYLISREYFEMAAMRFMTPPEARALRRENGARIFVSGLLPAVLAAVPIVNLAVPLFATSYFVHVFKQVQASSA